MKSPLPFDPQEAVASLQERDAKQRLVGGWEFNAFAERGWKLSRCDKPGCFEQGIYRITNWIPFGQDGMAESSEGWCPKHGWYEECQGRVTWWDEVDSGEQSA